MIISALNGSNEGNSGGGGGSVSYTKNPQKIPNSTNYEAFGFVEVTGANRVTSFKREGTSHLVAGRPYYRHLDLTTGTFSSKVYWDSDTLDFRDVWGGKMDNGQIICFTSTSANGAGGDWSSNVFYRICDPTTMIFGSRVSVPLTLERGTAFGKITYMGTAGHYAIALTQYNITGTTALKISVLITTDYFSTWSEKTVYSGTTGFTESCVAYFGSGKMGLIARAENLGHLRWFESTDSGNTWTDRGASNIGWYTNSDKIPFIDQHDGLIDIWLTDRDSLCVSVSKNNDPNTFFGSATLFNPESIYFYNYAGSSSNANLGYVSEIKIDTNKFYVEWARETGLATAETWYSLDDRSTPTSAAPIPVNIRDDYSGSIGTDYFRLDIDDYDSHLKDVDYFQIDVSTNNTFSSFISGNVNSPGSPTVTIQNIRMKGPNVNIYGLTSGTTYYARVRAVNGAGNSSYFTKTIITT